MKYLLIFLCLQSINSQENCLSSQECQEFVNTYPVYNFVRQGDSCIYSEEGNNYCITKCVASNCDQLIQFGGPYVQNYYAKAIGITTPPSPPPSSSSPTSSDVCTNESIPIRRFFINVIQSLGLVAYY